MAEPMSLASILAEQMKQFEPGTREHSVRKTIVTGDGITRQRRAMVLRHRDLAAKLCQPPLDYTRPENWNGYIPPDMFDESPNHSDRRTALLEIEAEAWQREQEGG